MKYFFIPGNHPALSAAELSAILTPHSSKIEKNWILVEKPSLRLDELQKTLGGTVKSGEIIGETSPRLFVDDACAYITKHATKNKKIFFGISAYGKILIKENAIALKQALKNEAIISRWVQSREKTLSSVVVQTNKLLSDRGYELVVLPHEAKLLLGVTKTVQPFAQLSQRDYGRPKRDAASGMIPPKLAKILINLAGIDKKAVLLDPFCGSGTILQEALMMGYAHVIGSDLSEKAISDTKKNLSWLTNNHDVAENAVQLFQSDVRALDAQLAAQTNHARVSAIITEPYLGPPLKGNESSQKIQKYITMLSALYMESFTVFRAILQPKGKIVIIFPIVRKKHLPILEYIGEIGYIQDPDFTPLYDNPERRSFTYSRPDQLVEREIFIFTRQNHDA